jgi:hypothetical protein
MKVLLSIITPVFITLTLAAQAYAVASDSQIAGSDHDYQVLSKGKTMDVVEFTPRNNTGYSCTVVTTRGQVVMNCHPKGEQ